MNSKPAAIASAVSGAGEFAMNKREFLKASGALITGGVLSRLQAEERESETRTNWAGNYEYGARRLLVPKTLAEVQELVKKSSSLKTLGTRHSFNNIADTRGDQISLKSFTDMSLDKGARTVTVGAGVTYGRLSPYLESNGYALHNLASLPHISVAGARSTGTHGSGVKNGNLSTAVSALEIVTAKGELVKLSRATDGERFKGAVVDLGGLGVVTNVTLDVQPTYQVSQVVYLDLPMSQLQNHLDEIFSSGYSVSLFTDWQNHRITQAWIKSKVNGDHHESRSEFFGAKLATEKMHPLAGHSPEACTEQLGVPGPWFERLPHFKMNFTPSSGAELQSEYFVPRDKGYEAILAVEKLRDQITPHLFITELRTIDADDLWMSPCYKRASMAIHFTWKPEWPAVRNILPMIEEQLAPFNPRPHWAKLFTLAPERIAAQYEKLADYKALLEQYDGTGKLRNPYLDRNIFG